MSKKQMSEQKLTLDLIMDDIKRIRADERKRILDEIEKQLPRSLTINDPVLYADTKRQSGFIDGRNGLLEYIHTFLAKMREKSDS